MFIFKILMTSVVTFFVYLNCVMADDLEDRVKELEAKLAELQNKGSESSDNASGSTKIYGNEFNPSIGIILNGRYNNFSAKTSEMPGFARGEEGERGREGILIDESELNFSSFIDDKFYGSLTAAIVREDGSDKVELEEAYIQTTPDFNFPTGMSLKAGRAFWTLGYLNEHHVHADDFADRPLPYGVYLNKGFNDDGAEITYLLPIDYYAEIGGGVFRGDDFPMGGSDGESFGGFSTFARIGGDIDQNQNWRIGAYYVNGKNPSGRKGNEDAITFKGDSDLYVADFRYTAAPTGNSREREYILQGEFFARNEDGTYNTGSGDKTFNGTSYGWYAQGIVKYNARWRSGIRYSQMEAPGVPTALIGTDLDSKGFDPHSVSIMTDWTNSEFSRIRWQFNREELSSGVSDNQYIIQYIVSIGAHGAHKF